MCLRRAALGLLIAGALAAGCNEGKQKIDTPGAGAVAGGEQDSSSSGGGGTDCVSKSNCPAADPDVSANFSQSGALLGLTNQAVDWDFHGVDKNSVNADQTTSTRNVAVLLDKIPQGSTITPSATSGQVTTEAKINWTPTTAQQGTLDVILRDMDRCMINETSDFCNQYTFHSSYDKRMSGVQWQIADKSAVQAAMAAGTGTATGADGATGVGNVVNVANPTCGKSADSDTDVALHGLAGFAGLLIPGGIIFQAPTLLNSVLSKPGTPTQC